MPGLDVAADRVLIEGALLLAKATLVMVGALAISRTLLRRDPAARHVLWTGTMLVLLLLPILSVAGTPGMAVPIRLLSASAGEGVGEAVLAPPSLAETSSDLPFADPMSPLRFPGASPGEFDTAPSMAAAAPTSAQGMEADPVEERASDAPSASGSWTERVASGLGLLWGAGAAILLIGLMVGIGRARRLIRGARPVSGREWELQARSMARRVGLRRPVPLRIAQRLGSPMAGGVVHPVVLLPPEAEGWTGDRREVVLLHELVHVRRRDPLRQILDRLVVALYWFHPLVRQAAREAASAREEACDRRVVELGAGPSRYASHLVELTDRPLRAPVGLTGFHHPNLEERIMSILAPAHSSRRGASLTSAVLALAWFGVVVVATPVASQTPPPVPPAPSQAVPPVQAESPTPPTPPVAAVDAPAAPSPLEPPAQPTTPPEAPDPAPPTSPAQGPDPVLPTSPAAPPPPAPGGALDVLTCELPGMVRAEGVRHFLQEGEDDGGVTAFRHASLEGYNVCLLTFGTVRLTDSGIRPSSMAPGTSVELVVASAEGSQRLRIRADDSGELHEEWFVNEGERALGPQVEAWRDALLGYLGATNERGRILGAAAQLRGEIARMNGERARLRGEIARAQGEVARRAGEAARLRGQEARLRGEIARLNGETARLRGQLYRIDDPEERQALEARIQTHTADVEIRAAEIETEIEALDTPTRLAQMEEEIERMRAETDREADAVRSRIDALTEEHEARTREIEAEIEALDVEARVAKIDARLPELRARAIAAIEAIGFDGSGAP